MKILHDVFSQLPTTPGLGKIVINGKCSEDSNKGQTGGTHKTKMT